MNRVALSLTKLWLRFLGAKFLKVSVITLSSGEKQNVAVFSSKAYFLLGQVTPWGTTIVHELAFSSDKLLDYIVVHESAHKRQWYSYVLYPLTTLWLVVPFMLVSALLSLVQAVISLDWAYLVGSIIILLTSAVVFAVPCFFSWVLEFLADCHAIMELGMQNVSEAIADAKALAETRGLGKPDLLTRIIGRMTHPPLTLTYRICRLLHRHETDDYP